MRKHGRMWVFILIVAAAAVFVFLRTDTEGPPYAPFCTAEMGTALFLDTLRHLGYPVRTTNAPLTRERDTRHAMVIIQPYNPSVSPEMAAEMLDWVRAGGRLVFLHNFLPTVIDRPLTDSVNRMEGPFTYYEYGEGAVVTGRAHALTNRRLMNDPAPGEALHAILSGWGAERIYFTAYYHGIHPPDTLFSQLPAVMRLVLVQLGIAAVALVWCLGKRFGKPVPAFEETEREENEQVRALARLYNKIK